MWYEPPVAPSEKMNVRQPTEDTEIYARRTDDQELDLRQGTGSCAQQIEVYPGV